MKSIIVALFIITINISYLSAQIKTDSELILNQKFENESYNERKIKFGFADHKNAIIKFNPINLTLSSLMFVYQKFISPQFSATCAYAPSCSGYSKALIKEYGIAKGVVCSSDRLMRCNRLALSSIKPHQIDQHDHKIHESVDYYRILNRKYNIPTSND